MLFFFLFVTVDRCQKRFLSRLRNTLDQLDLEIDKTVKAFGSELSAKEIWHSTVKDSDRILIFLKYISNFVHKGVRIVTNILNKGK